jgi:serine phosphatase RsbU (regulator of sigma subunit)
MRNEIEAQRDREIDYNVLNQGVATRIFCGGADHVIFRLTSFPLATLTIDEYLRNKLLPVEGAIPRLPGIEMHGSTVPAATVGGDVFEYINFEQRYNVEARIEHAQQLSQIYLAPLPPGTPPRNEVDVHVAWLASRPGYTEADGLAYRKAKSSEQLRVAENLQDLQATAGVLIVDAQGHGIIAAKIASTVHDTLHAFMMAELDRTGTTTPVLFERLNLRLAQSSTARNALGGDLDASSREIATLLYGEIRPDGLFRFVNFGHPPPLVFSAQYGRFMEIGEGSMAQFMALGLEIPEDHPDRNKYISVKSRKNQISSSDLAELTLMGRGDILFLYTDGVFDGSDETEKRRIEKIIAKAATGSASEICGAVLAYAIEQDHLLREAGHADEIDDKTVFIIKSI